MVERVWRTFVKAQIINAVSLRQSLAQPIILTDSQSMTTARYNQPSLGAI
jgi:hypothetical protein